MDLTSYDTERLGRAVTVTLAAGLAFVPPPHAESASTVTNAAPVIRSNAAASQD
jgi:hypothetical protein